MAEQVGGIYYEVSADTSKLVQQAREVDRQTAAMAGAFNKITLAIKLYAAALAVVKSAQLADDMRLLAARVQVAAGSLEKGAAAMNELRRIATATGTDLATTAGVFNRLNQSILQMGGNQADTLQITELLGKAIKVSGASGAEASSAMTQFGQALGSGKLAGDELRSLLENAPYLMQQLAKGIGVPVGALKQLGEDGKLTADVVTNALRKAAGSIDADFRKLPATFASATAALSDGAKRANEALDDLSGTSALVTGVTRGFAQVVDGLAAQLAAASTEADKLGRNDKVQGWAASTASILTYVVDAADFVTRAFRQMGVGIGGVAAAAGSAARGEFRQAADILAAMKSDILAIGDPKYAGAKLRQQFAALGTGTDGSDTLDRRARGSGSKLTPSKGGGDKKGGAKFDQAGYLAGLAKETADGIEKIDLIEQEALRKNAERLAQGKISPATAAKAVTLIEANAAFERREIALAEAEDRRQLIEQQGQDEIAAAKRIAQEQERGRQLALGAIGQGNEVVALQLELQQKSALLKQYAEQDQRLAALYAEAQVALEQQTAQRIAEITEKRRADALAAQQQVLQNYGSLFGNLSEITKGFAGEQSGVYKAMFAVSKAFAIADSIVKIQQGIAGSLSLPFPANLAAAASTAAAASGLITTIKGTNFGGGRQYGGPVGAGTLYRVNEGGRPEMFTAANGAQYMMPTADGKVTAAGAGGGAQVIELRVINQHAGASVSQRTGSDGRPEIVIAEVASQIAERRGPVWSALRTTNVQGRL